MLIRRPEKSSHYYLKNGQPFYTVENKTTGGLRPANIRDAFKAGAYRSVTNVLSVLDKPGLDEWKQEQCVLSALTLPRQPGEDDHMFAERVLIDAGMQAKKARERGTRLHELAQAWLITGTLPVSEEPVARWTSADLLAPFQTWCQTELDPEAGIVMAPETVMINHQHGYAGRPDLPVRMKDGSIAIADIKTTEVKRGPKGDAKPEFYDEWAMQLAALSRCIFIDGSYPPPMPWRLISLVVDTSQPGCYVHEWTDPANPLPSAEPHFQAFLAACRLWTYLKGGTPGIDLKAT